MGLQEAAETNMCWVLGSDDSSTCVWTREVVVDKRLEFIAHCCPVSSHCGATESKGKQPRVVKSQLMSATSEGQVGSKLGKSKYDFVVI